MKKPAGVIFDIGGVLIDFDHMIICRKLSQRPGLSAGGVYDAVFSSGLEAAYDEGRLTTDQFYMVVCERLGLRLGFKEFSGIWCSIFTEKPEAEAIVRGLIGKTELMLLSNTNELHFEFARRQFPFLDRDFQRQFLSYKIGKRKPDPEVFNAVIRTTGLKAGDLFFIDDKEEYVEACEGTGINAVRYTTPEDLRDALCSIGF